MWSGGDVAVGATVCIGLGAATSVVMVLVAVALLTGGTGVVALSAGVPSTVGNADVVAFAVAFFAASAVPNCAYAVLFAPAYAVVVELVAFDEQARSTMMSGAMPPIISNGYCRPVLPDTRSHPTQ